MLSSPPGSVRPGGFCSSRRRSGVRWSTSPLTRGTTLGLAGTAGFRGEGGSGGPRPGLFGARALSWRPHRAGYRLPPTLVRPRSGERPGPLVGLPRPRACFDVPLRVVDPMDRSRRASGRPSLCRDRIPHLGLRRLGDAGRGGPPRRGRPPGAGITFLITGPATNVSTPRVIAGLRERRAAVAFAAVLGGFAVTGGLTVDALFGGLRWG